MYSSFKNGKKTQLSGRTKLSCFLKVGINKHEYTTLCSFKQVKGATRDQMLLKLQNILYLSNLFNSMKIDYAYGYRNFPNLMMVTWSVRFGRNNACLHHKKRAKWRHLELCGLEREHCRTLKIPLYFIIPLLHSSFPYSFYYHSWRSPNFPSPANCHAHSIWNLGHIATEMWSEVINNHTWTKCRLKQECLSQKHRKAFGLGWLHTLIVFTKSMFNTAERLTIWGNPGMTCYDTHIQLQ